MRTVETKKGNGADKSGFRENCQEILEIKLGILLKWCFLVLRENKQTIKEEKREFCEFGKAV